MDTAYIRYFFNYSVYLIIKMHINLMVKIITIINKQNDCLFVCTDPRDSSILLLGLFWLLAQSAGLTVLTFLHHPSPESGQVRVPA